MNPQDVSDILDDITQRLAPASEAAWNIMVLQAQISSWFALFGGILLLVILLIAYRAIWLWTRRFSDRDSDDRIFVRIMASAVAIVGSVGAVDFIYNGVVGIIIPEWHIINKFLSILTGDN
jgi:hypothetical protein